ASSPPNRRSCDAAGQRPISDVRPGRATIPPDALPPERDGRHGSTTHRGGLGVPRDRAKNPRSGMAGNSPGARDDDGAAFSFRRRGGPDPRDPGGRRPNQIPSAPLSRVPPPRDATSRTRHEVDAP